MRKYKIEFKEEINIENPELFQDFDLLLYKRHRHLSKRRNINKMITVAAMLLIPVVFALGYVNHSELLKLFSEENKEQKVEAEPVNEEKADPIAVISFGETAQKEEKPVESVKEIKEELVAENSELEPGKDIVTSAIPEGGIEGLKAYFSNIIIYSEDDQEKNNYSEITVAFWINKQGTPERIKVIENLSPKVEAQVINAVKNMPRWQPAKVKEVPYRTMISFKIQFKVVDKGSKIK